MSRHANQPKRAWSKLKKRVESLWLPALKLAIHCTVYVETTSHGVYESPRHWIAFNKEIIWDFPSMFLKWKHPNVQKPLEYLDETYHGWYRASDVSVLLHEYVDVPRDGLLQYSFTDDYWGLTDILRAADRRLGRERLVSWGESLPPDSPGRKLLAARFHQEFHHEQY
jgi:hypothetical protein